ncbi:Gfo/Idh/MocA family protein [Enterococcus sp. AZ109]|uniref:Gfo/Idh/MocA family protein n=1 Tax=Enterococcus sp. AZ109 TaxID=2774634 RepID=UPI003F29B6C3
MKIGVIGLGGIAQKAYLPTYAKLSDQATFIFSTRQETVRKKVSQKYRFQETAATIDELLAKKIDACFIHAATSAHYALAKKCLEQNVAVFIDKPVSENYNEVKQLTKLAQERNLIFMVGFNRRFAPMVEELYNLPEKRVIHLEKNEVNHPLETTYGIYDLFIHLVDTGVYLLNGKIDQVHTKISQEAGKMTYARMLLSNAHTEAHLTMDLRSGFKAERYQVTNAYKTLVLDQLTDLMIKEGNTTTVQRFGDWTTTLEKRGFEQMVLVFLAALKGAEPVIMKQEHILLSHRLCQEMINQQILHEL